MTKEFRFNGYPLGKNQTFIPQGDIKPNWELIEIIPPSKNPSLLLQAREAALTATGLYENVKFVQEQSTGIGRGVGQTGRYGFVVTLKPQPQEVPAQ